MTRKTATEHLQVSSPTAGAILDDMCAMGILRDATPGKQRNKRYLFQAYLDIPEEGTQII